MARSLVASDNFNRADANLGGGDGWTQINTGWGNVAIVSNALPEASDNGANVPAARWTGDSFASDQYAKLEIVAYAFNQVRVGACAVRMSGSGSTQSYYAAFLDETSSTIGSATTKIAKVVNNVFTSLSSVASDGFALNDTCEIEAEGTTIRVMKNGVELRNVTDTDLDDADLAKIVGVVSIAASDYSSFADNAVGQVRSLQLPFVMAAQRDALWAILVSRGTPTFAAGADVTLRVHVLPLA